ncbi:MAG: MFS transporter [Desulfobacterales bacterium]|nr:MAG: MFS transporter [Desulfobacterales bacterium]
MWISESSRPVKPTDADNRQSAPQTSPLGQLLILTSIFFVNFIARIILAPLLPKVEVDLGLTHGAAGSQFLLISLGYFIALLGSGLVASRLTHKRTIVLSSVALGMALLGTSFGRGLWGMRLGLLALGMGAGLYLPSGLATITSLFSTRQWGKAIAVHELAPNLSFVAAPLVSEAIMAVFASWRMVFLLLGAAALLLAGVYARFGRGGEFCGATPNLASFRNIISNPALWVMMILFGLGISGTLGLYTMLPLYLVSGHALERSWANTLLALSRITGLGMALIGGWATDRYGARRILTAVFLSSGTLTLLLALAPTSWIAAPVVLQPLAAVCFFPAGLAALSMVSAAKDRNIAISLTIPVAFVIGGGAVPALIGFIGDVSSFSTGILLVGGLILAGAMLPRFLQFHQPSDLT